MIISEIYQKYSKLESEYFSLLNKQVRETDKCIFRATLVNNFNKCDDESIEKAYEVLIQKVEELKKQKHLQEIQEKQLVEELKNETKKSGFCELQGSIKQVKWANELRIQLIQKVDKIKEQSQKDEGLKILKAYFSNEDIEITSLETIDEILNYILTSKKEATYFINNRYNNIFDTLITEYKNMKKGV